MKVAFAEHNIHGQRGLKETQGFQIRTNAHAFKLLSSGLYANKIAAVLREIGCNAADAHIAAGTPDLPIEVKLPNRLDRQFYIKDWGPGLSHREVMDLYTTYFASTKQESNDFTGAFGLGSKSPFSYTDSFTVVSVHGGTKRTYVAAINNKGSPEISLLAEENGDKTWTHGMSIGFSVKEEDVQHFHSQAALTYQWFRVSPRILGGVKITKPELVKDEPEFAVLKNTKNCWALMGNVAYPINAANLQLQNANSAEQWVLNMMGLVLKLDIGEVQVAASREELQYDADTIKVLRKAILHAGRHILEGIKTQIDALAKTGWPGYCALPAKATELFSNHTYYIKEIYKAYGYSDGELIHRLCTQRHFTVDKIKYPRDCWVRRFTVETNSKGPYLRTEEWDPNHHFSLALTEKTLIVDGVERHALARIKAALIKGDYIQIILVGRHKDDTTSEQRMEDAAADLSTACRGIPQLKLADLPIPETVKVANQNRTKRKKGVLTALPPAATVRIEPAGKLVNINALPAEEQFYVLEIGRSNYGSTARKFLAEPGSENGAVDHWVFERLKTSFFELATKLGDCPMKGFFRVRRPLLVSWQLEARGWKNALVVMREYLRDPDVRKRLEKQVGDWVPSAHALIESSIDPMTIFVGLKKEYPKEYAKIIDTLDDMGVYEMVQKVADSKARLDMPSIISKYQDVAGALDLDDVKLKPITLDDMNAYILDRWPLMNEITWGSWKKIAESRQTLAFVQTFLKVKEPA